MTNIQIRAGGSSYDVVLGSQVAQSAGELISERIGARRCAVITDENLAQLWAAPVQKALTASGVRATLIAIPAGELSKTLQQIGVICDQMIAAGLDRESFVVGIGGGVIGDISGFAAAVFQRGIPHVQIPTTLLAMVDSSIGGKTGVNTAAGKNLIGAVHHPLLVIDDVDILRTLPERELRQGYAEIVKHAIINDAEMFEQLAKGSGLRIKEISSDTLTALIGRNIEIKARIISEDQHDRTGERALLNFGHTIGHGIERAGGYEQLLHGEAISLGIIAAANISVKKAGLPLHDRDQITEVLARFGLPTRLPDNFPREQILEALKFDKKFEQGQIRFVVTPRIGSAQLSKAITWEDIREAVAAL